MELKALPEYLIEDSILFLDLAPAGLVFISSGLERAEDREPQSRDIVDCMLAFTNQDPHP